MIIMMQVKYSIAAFLAAIFFSFWSYSQVNLSASNGLLSNNVNSMYIDDQGTLWLGTDRSVSQVSNWSNSPSSVNRSTSVPINSICEFQGDLLWVATNGKGIYKYNKKTREMSGYRQDILMNKNIVTLKFTDNKLFVEIENEGWLELNLQNNSERKVKRETSQLKVYDFEHEGVVFTTEDGLSDNKYLLKSDQGECFFLLTSKGLDVFHKAYHSVKNIIQESWKINQFIEKDGMLLLATNKGYYCFSYAKEQKEFKKPEIKFSSWKIDDEVQSNNDADLTFDDYVFSFEIDASSFPTVAKNYYRINEGEWIECQTKFELTDLTNGDYQIDFKACDKANFCLEKTLVNFHIDHPLKKNWIKYAAFIVAAVIYTMIVVFLTRKKYKADIAVLEEAVIEKQNKLNKLDHNLKDN